MAAAIGLLLSLPILVGCAAGGAYSPAAIGGLGWLLSGWLARRGVFRGRINPRWDPILITVAVILAGWHVHFRTESIFAGRDQGVYSNHAVHLAQEGQLRVNTVYRDLFEPSNWALAPALQAGGYFFDFEAEHITLQFAPTYALYLAQGYGAAGFLGLFAVNPLLAAINAVLFFGLARRCMTKFWALAATALFALNLAQVWIARITLSEVLTQTWLLAGLVAMRLAFAQQHQRSLLIGGLLVASCSFVRVDAFLLIIALAASGAYLAQQPRERLASGSWRQLGQRLALSTTLLGAVSLGYGMATSPGYYADFSSRIALMLGISAGLCLVAWTPISNRVRSAVFTWAGRPITTQVLMIIVIGLACYAYFWRPYHEPFANFAASIGWEGRDYRENSLRDLGAYLSPLTLALGLGGLGILLHRTLIRGAVWPVPLLGVWFAYTLLYLYNPYISTDHIWKIRRFVPVVIPGFALLSMIGLAGLGTLVQPRRLKGGVIGVGLLGIFGYVGWSGHPLAFTRLNAGAVQFIQQIGERIPDNALVVTEVTRVLLGPLQLVEQLDGVKALPEDPLQHEIVAAAIARASAENRPVVVVGSTPLVSDISRNAERLSLTHASLVKTINPPPREIASSHHPIFISVLDPNGLGYRATAASLQLGANRVHGVIESGFMQQEFSAGTPFRWTTETVSLRAPWIFDRAPFRVELQIMAAAPGGSEVSLSINQQTVLETVIPETGGVFEIPLDEVDWTRRNVDIQLHTSTFVPAKERPGATDHRELGVQVGGILFHLIPPWEIGHWEFGMEADSRVHGRGLYNSESLNATNARWTDGHAHWEIEIPREHPPSRLIVPFVGGPRGESPVSVRWNGQEVASASLTQFPHHLKIDLANLPSRSVSTLEIVSPSFVPAETDPNSTDTRKLGVMLGPLKLEW